MALGWDPGLGLLGGASGGGGFFGARNPEPPRNFGWNCISLGRAGVIQGKRLRTHKLVLRWLLIMQPLLCALAGLALLGVEAGEWDQGPRDTPGRRGRNERGTGDRDTGRRGGKER